MPKTSTSSSHRSRSRTRPSAVASCGLRVAGCECRVASCGLRVADGEWRVAGFGAAPRGFASAKRRKGSGERCATLFQAKSGNPRNPRKTDETRVKRASGMVWPFRCFRYRSPSFAYQKECHLSATCQGVDGGVSRFVPLLGIQGQITGPVFRQFPGFAATIGGPQEP